MPKQIDRKKLLKELESIYKSGEECLKTCDRNEEDIYHERMVTADILICGINEGHYDKTD